jgi:C4-dicarboxylate transporter
MMIKVKDILPDYTTPINNFGQICLITAVVGLGSGFVHRSISTILVFFGCFLFLFKTYRRDKRRGIKPFSNSYREYNQPYHYNKQETQLATIGGILIILSLISGGFARYMGEVIYRAIIVPLFG